MDVTLLHTYSLLSLKFITVYCNFVPKQHSNSIFITNHYEIEINTDAFFYFSNIIYQVFLKIMKKNLYVLLLFILFVQSSTSHAWHDKTHIAIAKAAGYQYWFNAAGADIAKIKAGDIEEKNHYYNNYENAPVTDKMVLDQIKLYNSPSDNEGHLYGAIVAALRDYQRMKSSGKYAEYHMAFAVHYIGDLSQPLHNLPYDHFNKIHHLANDGIVDDDILDKIKEIEKNMYEIKLANDNFEEDLAKEIARIANISRQLGMKLKADNRNMTKEEAYAQLGHSASLLRAVLNSLQQ